MWRCVDAGFGKEFSAGEGRNALVYGFRQLVKADFRGGGGEKAGKEGGFTGIAEEGKLSGAQGGSQLPEYVCEGLRGGEEQRGGDGALQIRGLQDGHDGVGAAAAVAGISGGVES